MVEIAQDGSRSLIHRVGDVRALLRERLWLQVVIAMILGVALGTAISPSSGLVRPSASLIMASWLALPGQAFLAAIKFVVIPLVLASVIRGIAAGDNPDVVGSIGVRTVIFFILTTVIAVIIGLAVALIVQPGNFIDPTHLTGLAAAATPGTAAVGGSGQFAQIPGQIVALVPTNLLTHLVQGEMLHIVIGSAIVGIALLAMPAAQSKPIMDLLAALQAVCMVIVKWVLRFAPIAVFGLMADIATRIGLKAITGMAVYMATVVAGLILLLAVYLLIVLLAGRRSPLAFLRDTREALLLAF